MIVTVTIWLHTREQSISLFVQYVSLQPFRCSRQIQLFLEQLKNICVAACSTEMHLSQCTTVTMITAAGSENEHCFEDKRSTRGLAYFSVFITGSTPPRCCQRENEAAVSGAFPLFPLLVVSSGRKGSRWLLLFPKFWCRLCVWINTSVRICLSSWVLQRGVGLVGASHA